MKANPPQLPILMPATRSAVFTILFALVSISSLHAQPGKRSQLATVTQLVGPAKLELIYRRPVARGRELFGKLVPWGRIWTPSADSAAVFSTSVDIDVNGTRLGAGTYGLWMIPDADSWTAVFTSAPHAFHLSTPRSGDEVLRVRAKPTAGDHMESLGFYFPMVDADSALLVMHWGKTVVPLRIKARS
jgi:hypothetical protein